VGNEKVSLPSLHRIGDGDQHKTWTTSATQAP